MRRTFIASACMLLAMLWVHFLGQGRDVDAIKPFSSFPKEIGPWQGKEARFADQVYEVLGVSDSFLANYGNGRGGQAQLYIGYYRSQRQGQTIHSPLNCLPGGGWNILQKSEEDLPPLQSSPEKVPLKRLLVEKAGQRYVVLYWFQARGRYNASEYWEKIYLVLDSMTRQRTDGAFIRLMAPAVNGSEGAALESLRDFARELVPVLKQYIPS